jgi:hypothetical protein
MYIRNLYPCTVNDIFLACLSGALRKYAIEVEGFSPRQVLDANSAMICDIRPIVAYRKKDKGPLFGLDWMTNYSFPYSIILPCSLKNSVISFDS